MNNNNKRTRHSSTANNDLDPFIFQWEYLRNADLHDESTTLFCMKNINYMYLSVVFKVSNKCAVPLV